MTCPVVALISDFGWTDPWLAEMKGALFSAWARWPADVPRPAVVDAVHDIPPGDVGAAAWFLQRVMPRFPAGTIFLAVVDPGVGTERAAVACQAAGRFCVGPGNGLFTAVTDGDVVVLDNELYHGDPAGGGVSATFHGRDVFAPAAAHLALGAPLEQVGSPAGPEVLGAAPARPAGPAVRWIDRFGNAVTDLARESTPGTLLAAGGAVVVGGTTVHGPYRTYGEAPAGTPFWYWGSGGTVEIAVQGGDAAARLGLQTGLVLAVVAT